MRSDFPAAGSEGQEYSKSDLEALQKELTRQFGGDRVRHHEPLSRHSNWKAGGPADLFLVVRTAQELVHAVRLARQHNQPLTVIGFGANILVSDRGIRGLVILNRAERIACHPGWIVEADSGTSLAVLAKRAAEADIGGLEFLIGIPGTVGGAVVGNAGTRLRWIETVLDRVRVVGSNGDEFEYAAADLEFSYRHSRLKQTGDLVLTAWLRGYRDKRVNIERNMEELLRQRKHQPPGPSAGSVFKNPPGQFAGRLIEQCGLKGYRIGGARISDMHANFIVNLGGGNADDIKALIEHAKKEVNHRTGIMLEEEICYLGDWS